MLSGGSGGNPSSSGSPGTTGTITATAPWRLKVIDEIRGSDNGCSITLTDADGTQLVQETLFGESVFNIYQSGSFNWRINDSECAVVQLTGMEKVKLPHTFDQSGATDTPAFVPPGPVTVHVLNFYGDSYCHFILYDAADGRVLDDMKVTPENDTLTFSAAAGRTVYLRFWNCTVEVSPGR